MMEVAINPSGKDDMKYDEMAVRCAADDVLRAEKVKEDPKMWKLVQAELKKRGQQIEQVVGDYEAPDEAPEPSEEPKTGLAKLKAKAAAKREKDGQPEEYS